MLTLLAAALLAVPGAASTGLTANVNDPASHGLVGDGLLSLDEAIRLANGTLSMNLLSAAERAQVTGTGTMVDTIVVDPMVTPMITLSAPLTDVTGMGMGMVSIQAMSMMPMPRPILVGGSQPRIMTLRTHRVSVMGLQFRGGQVGIDIRTTMGSMTAGNMAMVMDCWLESQTTAGIRLGAGGTAETTASMVMNTFFRNMPVGILVDDQSNMGGVMSEDDLLDFDGVGIGYDITGNGLLSVSMNMVFRSTMVNGAQFARVVRGPQSTQQYMLRVEYCHAVVTGNAIDITGCAPGLSMVHHHHNSLQTGTGAYAFRAVPRTALFDLHGSENTFTGNVTLSGNLFTQRVWHQNNIYRSCTLTIDNDGAQPGLMWDQFANSSAVVVTAASRTPVLLRQCQLGATPVTGSSTLAPVTLQGCWQGGAALTGQVLVQNPAPGPFLGTTTVDPVDPQIGTSVALRADLPYGVGAFWDIGISNPRPDTTQEPFRFYGDPATAIVLPGMVVFQSRIDVPVPNNPVLVGVEFYAQALSIPLLGQTFVPPLHLPIGGLIRPRM
jgi:hypothetical protein